MSQKIFKVYQQRKYLQKIDKECSEKALSYRYIISWVKKQRMVVVGRGGGGGGGGGSVCVALGRYMDDAIECSPFLHGAFVVHSGFT